MQGRHPYAFPYGEGGRAKRGRMRSHASNIAHDTPGGRRNSTPTQADMAIEVPFLTELQKYPLYR